MLTGGGLTAANSQVFTLETNLSSVTISGTVMGASITEQGPGSLTASVGGTIQASLAGNTIQFTGRSQILVETNGNWQPAADGTAGSAPGDFGVKANLGIASGVAAARNMQFDVTSSAVNVIGGQFGATNLTFSFASNTLSSLAYNVSGLISKHGSVPLTGSATNNITSTGSLAKVGNEQTLTIPLDATFYLGLISTNDTMIRMQGQLVAAQSAEVPLVINSVTVQGQSLRFQWQATPGSQFQVQYSTNLKDWTNSATVITPASGTNTWTESVVGSFKFFRVAK